MPELPEVETAVSSLKKKILDRRIEKVWTDTPKIIKKPSIELFKKNVKGSRIKNVLRKGKNIILELDNNRAILIHQKMTGHLLVGKWIEKKNSWKSIDKGPLSDPMNRFLHLIFFLDNGKMLALSDLRKFAKVILATKEEIKSLPEIKKLGPDALKVKLINFKKRIKTKENLAIKKVLMDQEIISGIGNIYSDEILFVSRINPFKKVKDLKDKDVEKIFKNTKKILKIAIKLKGESISDYRTPDGKKGNFDKERKVYRREGENCPNCGEVILRKKINNRSTHYCPKCQPL